MSGPLAPDMVDQTDAMHDPDELVSGGRSPSDRLRIALILLAVIAVAGAVYFLGGEDGANTRGSADVINGGDLGAQSDAMALSERLAPELAERDSPGGPVAPGSVPCDDSEAALPQDQAELVYSARLDWEGTPAVVLGYRVEGPSLARLLLVMAEADCRLIVTQSF